MKFTELKVKQEIIDATIKAGYENLTEIQELAIPSCIEGRDVIAQAPTGTGKTCAFGIPLLQNVDTNNSNIQALVLCPTRELAMQIAVELKKIGALIRGLDILTIYGGQDISKQMMLLKKKPQIIIATPGRLIDHIERRTINLNNIKTFVLDEADEMLNMGFRDDIDQIIKTIGRESQHQTTLFSATLSKEIIEISKKYQKDPVSFKVQLNENDLPDITQYYVAVSESNKIQAIHEIIKKNGLYLTIIFSNTRRRAKVLVKQLSNLKYKCDALHSDLKQNARDRVMRRFRTGELQILVATDIAARGIDVNNIDAVFNYDVPKDMEYYVHRIGRTARAKRTGIAYTLISSDLRNNLRKIERATNSKLNEYKIDLPNAETFSSEIGSFERPEKKREWKDDANNVRFFVNLGKRDGLDSDEFKKLVLTMTGLNESELKDHVIFDNFAFIQTEKDRMDVALKMNGQYHNERKINIEVAQKRSENKSFSDIARGPRTNRFSSDGGNRGRRTFGERNFQRGSYSSGGERRSGFPSSSTGERRGGFSSSGTGERRSSSRFPSSGGGERRGGFSSGSGERRSRFSSSSSGERKTGWKGSK